MGKLYEELKRRNVVRVGVAYLVVGWLILQVIDIVVPLLDVPDWVGKTVLIFLIAGLPVALFFAWAFEMTPQGVKKTAEVDLDASITPSTGQKLDRMIIGALALAVAFLVYDRFNPVATAPPESVPGAETPAPAAPVAATAPTLEKSIAVLPFSNLSGNKETDSFVAGLHDDLLTQLAKIHDLKVISRTSVLRYAGTTRSLKEIAAELGVATIMEGGIQRAGNRVRINVQLINSETDEHIWAETYDRVLTTENVFDIQSEITRQIAAALKAALTPAEEAGLDERPTENLAAYEAYLNSKLLEERYRNGGEDTVDEAIAAAKLAVSLDPNFAEAWSQLAYVQLNRFWFVGRDQVDAGAARASIQRAGALKPDAPEVGLMLGLYHYWVNYDYASALPELDGVLATQPGNEQAWAVRGYVLRRSGRWEEALVSLKKAASLNPNDVNNAGEVAYTMLAMRRYDEALQWLREREPRFPGDENLRIVKESVNLATTGDADPMVTTLRRLASQENPDLGLRLAYVLLEAGFGDPQRALDYLDNWAPGLIDVQYQFWPADLLRAYIHYSAGRTGEAKSFAAKALPAIEAARRFEPNEPDIEKAMAYALALMGRADGAEAAARRVRQIYPRSRDDWGGADYLISVTEALAIAGRHDLAIGWLDEYLSGGAASITLLALKSNHFFKELAGEPGFAALVKKYGLVPEDRSPKK
ncbi:MAG: tetratricopeptide repeat protein [Sphingomonadales bacterium]